jgi:uncharacterized protein YdaU (DUF1376 family)
MDRPDAWMPHYIGDYNMETIHLSAQQDGIYRRLRDYYWKNGGPIPDDINMIYRAARALSFEEKQDVEFIVNSFFIMEGNYIRHLELDKRYHEACERYEKKSEAGKKAVAAREQKKRERSTDVSNDKQTTPTTISREIRDSDNQPPPDFSGEENSSVMMSIQEFHLLHQTTFNCVMNENLEEQAARICKQLPKDYIEEGFMEATENGTIDFSHLLSHFNKKIEKMKNTPVSR